MLGRKVSKKRVLPIVAIQLLLILIVIVVLIKLLVADFSIGYLKGIFYIWSIYFLIGGIEGILTKNKKTILVIQFSLAVILPIISFFIH